jgi:hypothetical protein
MDDINVRPVKHPSRGQRIVYGIALFTLGIASVLVAIVLYWTFTGQKALEVTNAPVPVKPKFVKSLEQITINVDFCKHTDVSGRVIRKLVSDKTELFAPVTFEQIPRGCYEDLEVKIPIPDQTPPGKYKVVYRVTYQTNPLHEVISEFESQQFEVVQ